MGTITLFQDIWTSQLGACREGGLEVFLRDKPWHLLGGAQPNPDEPIPGALAAAASLTSLTQLK